MKNINNKQDIKRSTAIKKKLIFSSIFVLISLITVGVSLIMAFKDNNDDGEYIPPKNATYTEVSSSNAFKYYLVDNNNKYSITTDKYAVIYGIDWTTVGSVASGTDGYNLCFPETISHSNGLTYDSYPVKEINCLKPSATGTEYTVGDYRATYFNMTSTESNKVLRVEVPKCVEYIEFGSFHGLNNIQSIKLPFIGTKRGNRSCGTTAVSGDGYESAFLALFGNGALLNMPYSGGALPASKQFIKEINNPKYDVAGSSPTGGNGCIDWYDTDPDVATLFFCPYYLTDIEITDELIVPTHAFLNMFNIENVEISLQNSTLDLIDGYSIGDYVFAANVNLKSCELPSNATSMGKGVFNMCHELIDVKLPNSLTSIPEATFYQCSKIQEITLPFGVEKIGKQAFMECTSLKNLKASLENGSTSVTADGVLTLPQTVKVIDDQAFRDCDSFEKAIIPNGVEEIGKMVFNACGNLNSIVLPFVGRYKGNSYDPSLNNGGQALFGYIFGEYGDEEDTIQNKTICSLQTDNGDPNETSDQLRHFFYIPSGLKNVTILNETYIAPGAFMNCKNIVSLTIQSSAAEKTYDTDTVISQGALHGCAGLEHLEIPFVGRKDNEAGQFGYIFGTESYNGASPTEIYGVNGGYWYIPSSLTSVTLQHQTVLWSHSFYRVNMIEDLTIGKNTVQTQRNAFTDVLKLKNLTLPFIGEHRGIENDWWYWSYDRNIRNSLIWIFSYMGKNIAEHYENNWVTDWQAPRWNASIPSALTRVTVTDDTAIDTYAFRGFSSLKEIFIDIPAENLSYIDYACMIGCSNLEYIEVPYIGRDLNTQRVNSYVYTIGWFFGQSYYSNSYAASQMGATFYIPKNLKSISIKGAIQCIPAYAFANLTSVVSVTSDAIIQTLGSYAFYNCRNLQILDLDNANYVKVGDYAFANCVALGEMENFLPTTVKEIGHHALQGTSISHIMNFTTLTYVGDYAFANCLSLEEIDFTGTNLNYCGSGLFSGCKRLKEVTLSKYLTPYMFQNCQSLEDMNLIEIYKLDESVRPKNIPAGLFDGCINLKSPYVDGLGNKKGLQIDVLASGITTIDAYAFRGCESLETFTLPETLLQIKSGAFQKCIKLEKIRIPSDCYIMQAGTKITKALEDDFDNGIFYGCNDDFYLEVYYAEKDWPTTWGYNWNCYYPVYIIGDSTENLFTYEYSPDLKGYLISGLNKDVEFVHTYQSGYKTYLLNGTLTFPSTYNGLYVFGLMKNAFANYQDELSQIDTFVLGDNFIELGEDSLSMTDSSGYYRTVVIYSNLYASTASQILSFDGLDGFIYESCGGVANTENINYSHYFGASFDQESTYAKRGIVIYKDAWRYVGTSPTILMSALNFKFEQDEYTFNLGNPIIPKITKITPNESVIKYTNDLIYEDGTDIIKNIFYEYNSGAYADTPEFGLDNVNIQYKNNINVGTASVIFSSNTSALFGQKVEYFQIIKYELDLFFESDEAESYKDYGTSSWASYYMSAYEIYLDYLTNGNLPQTTAGRKDIVTETTYGFGFTNSVWTQGDTVLNLPEGYRLVGTLTTTSPDAGIYVSYKTDIFTLGLPEEKIAGGFKWTSQPKVYDSKGKDVTRNFSFMITLMVEIKPYVITELQWPGFNSVTNQYEFKYTGEAIVPVPKVYNDAIGYLDPSFSISVSPQDAIDPYEILAVTYTAEVVGWNQRNFVIPDTLSKKINFIIVKGEVTIEMNVIHTILENENYYLYPGGYSNGSVIAENFSMTVSGLGPSSVMTGYLVTSGWQKGLYSSDPTNTNAIGTFGWDTTNGLNITSSQRHVGDNEENSFLDETSRYNVTLNINCEIKYQKLDFELTMTEFEADGTENTYLLDSALQVINKNFTKDTMYNVSTLEIEYGADGYQHELGVLIYNILTPASLSIKFSHNTNITNNVFTFTDIDTYQINLLITKDKFEDVNFNIKLNVVHGNYIFDSLSKEYDRDPIDPLEKLLRKPIDYDASDFSFTYYNLATGDLLDSAPYQIGSYKVIIKTKENHSDWFNDIPNVSDDGNYVFAITPRRLIIKVVDNVDPYDSKTYDGEPWKYTAVDATDASLNLLPGDTLTGQFMSRSADIGTYCGAVSGDFIASYSWKINNATLGEQTSNYKLVYEGDYTILPRQIIYSCSGETLTYDGLYHTITVNVTEPTENYHIYYSESSVSIDPSTGNDYTNWSMYPFYYNEPGTYTIYFKIEAPTYETVYDSATIVIEGKDPTYTVTGALYCYDGFAHTINVDVTEPKYATVLYASIPQLGNYNSEELAWSTIPNSYVKPGTYNYVIRIIGKNYNPKEFTYVMQIVEYNDAQHTLNITATGYDGNYDRESHGPTIDISQSGKQITDLIINYAFNDSNYNADTSTWYNMSLEELSSGTYTSDLFTEAGTYKLMLRIMCKNMSIKYIPVEIKINELELDIEFDFYKGPYDGKYHTVLLNLKSGSTDTLVVNGSVEDGDLSYQYKTMINGVEEIVDLTVYYYSGVINLPNIPFTTQLIRYKNVISTYFYIRVEAPNFKTLYDSDTFYIEKVDPTVTYDDPCIIQYLARPVEPSDFTIETCHDGAAVYTFKEYSSTGVLSTYYITNPINLGKYRVYVTYSDTINCVGKSIAFDLEIVPRELTVTYEKELQYTGSPQIPEVTVTTGTTDTVVYVPIMYDPVNPSVTPQIPTLPGTYYFILNEVYQNDNYVLKYEDQGGLEYKIVNRKVYVEYNEETDYTNNTFTITTTYDSGIWAAGDVEFNVSNLLIGDSLTATLTTSHVIRGTYVFNSTYSYDINTNTYSLISGIVPGGLTFVLDNIDVYKTGTTDIAPYYDIVFDVTLKVVAPELEVQYDDYIEVIFDGEYHYPTITVNSYATEFEQYKYWLSTNPNETQTAKLGFRNVGTYEICFEILTGNYEPFYGVIVMNIIPVTISATIDDYTAVYNGQKHQTTYNIVNTPMNLTPSEEPELFYFRKDTMDLLGYDYNDIKDFFMNGTPSVHQLYAEYFARQDYMINAGEYYAILYFASDDSAEYNNINRNVVIKLVKIEQRTLYFRYTGTDPIALCKYYDGLKYTDISLGNFVYDTTPTSSNHSPDAGLLAGHYIENENMGLGQYFVRTVSANARGNHCGENNGDPYQAEGDFEFQYISITNYGGKYFEENYRPAFTKMSYNGNDEYPLQVTIKRIALNVFEVEDTEVEYNGEQVFPEIDTPSDGEVVIYYLKTDENYNVIDTTKYYNQTDVGYYIAYVHIALGTNYYAWQYPQDPQYNDFLDPDDGLAYRFAKLRVIPAKVGVIWDTLEVVYDGENHHANPVIYDVHGVQHFITYDIIDKWFNEVNTINMLNAGSYNLVAKLNSASGIINPDNYELTNDIVTFNILKREYDIFEQTKEPWLKDYWSKTYTQYDFVDFLPGFSLDLTVKTKSPLEGIYQYASQFDVRAVVTDNHGNTSLSSGINIAEGETYAIANNFQFNLNMFIVLDSKEIKVETEMVDEIYQDKYFTPIVDVVSHQSGYSVNYAWTTIDNNGVYLDPNFSESSINYTTTVPRFKDVGYYKVFYRIDVAGPEGVENSVFGVTYVRIRQRDAYLNVSTIDKVYDGTAINMSNVEKTGGFNGTTSEFKYEFKRLGDPDTSYTTTSPKDVGEYQVRITSTADNNPNFAQNWTTLDTVMNVFDFKITPAVLTFVVDDDMEITSEVNVTYNESGTIVNNQTGTLPEFYVNGLCGSDGFKYKIISVNGQYLQRKTYLYSDAIATSALNYYFYTNDLFYIEWSTYDQNNSDPATNDTSNNYYIKLVFELTVHFPHILVDVVAERTVEYTGQPIYVMDSANAIVVNNPVQSDCTFSFGESYGTYNSQNNISKTDPGTYIIYFRIEANNYETYYGQTKLIIKYKSREDNLNLGDISKTYDATAYDGTNHGVPAITWITDPGEGIPSPSTWTIEYFTADNSTGEWLKSSEPMDSVINAGDYIYRVTIPAGTVYGQTVVEKYFKIERKVYKIQGNVSMQYTGNNWSYTMTNTVNPENFQTDGLIQNDADGNPVNHKLETATFVSSAANIGKYGLNSSLGTNRIYISDQHAYKISDNNVNQNENDVTINYEYVIEIDLEITKGQMQFESNIPASGKFNYTGEPINPMVYVILPSGQKCEYSTDGGVTWVDSLSYTNCGTYSFLARCINVPNYEDKEEPYSFTIEKKQNKLVINSIDKEYDGQSASLPVIETYDYVGIAQASKTKYFDSSHSYLPQAPTNVGDYYVRVSYDDTANYTGLEAEISFKITPCKLKLEAGSVVLTYNAKQQAPSYVISSIAYPTWELMSSALIEGQDYSVQYFDQSDATHSSPLAAKPKNVGNYTMVIKLLGSTNTSAATNFDFDNGTDEISVNYSIAKVDVTISYTGILKYNAGNTFVIPLTDISVTGLPQGATLTSYIETKTGEIGTYAVNGSHTSTNFTNSFKWNPDNPDPLIMYDGSSEDVATNYNIIVDLDVSIRQDQLPYSVAKYEGVYDGEYHSFEFNIVADPSDNIEIKYSTDGGNTFSSEKPKYKDCTNGVKHIIVKVISDIYGTVILGSDTLASDYDEFTVKITKADTTLDTSQIVLDKIYDDKYIENPDVPYTHFGTDDLSQYLTYEYYQQDYLGIGSIQYSLVNRIDVKNVGSYYVVIKMNESPNYNSYTCDPIYFNITPRTVVINIPNQNKVYDGLPWSAMVSNDPTITGVSPDVTISGVSGVTESGLVPGHMFTGKVKTISANAGSYTLPNEFTWENSYKIYKDLATEINSANYEILLNIEALISKADFDITLEDGVGVYDGVTEYFIKHTWNTYPIIQLANGLTNAQIMAAYDALIEYSLDGFNGPWQHNPIGKMYGTTTVYVKVSADNYNTYYGEAQIIVTPLNSDIEIEDLGVLAQDKVYDGKPYDDSTIIVKSSIPNDTRVVYFEYYLRNDDGTIGNALSGPPTDAGKYMIVMKMDADVANGLSAYESEPIPFNVVPEEIPVIWAADKVKEVVVNGQLVKKYQMQYTGSDVLPFAKAYGVVNIGTDADPEYELIPLDVTLYGATSSKELGTYQAKAAIIVSPSNKYSNNYTLLNPIQEYEVTVKLTPGPGGDDPTPGPSPDPDPDHEFLGIEFRTHQYNPLATQANTPFVYGEEIVIEVTYHYGDSSLDKTYIYHMDKDNNWKIIEIRDNTDTTVIDANPSPIFHFEFPQQLSTPEFKVKAVIDDKLHCAWNTDGDTADVEIIVHMKALDLDPDDPDNPDIRIEVPTQNSKEYTGSQVTFDQTKTNEQIKVYLTKNTPADTSDDELIDPSRYTVYYGNNINPTSSDGNPYNNAYFIVKSNDGDVYSYSFGDYSAYKTLIDSNASDPDYIHKNAAEAVAQTAPFTFEIFSPEPQVITLKDNSTIKFVSYEQDFADTLNLTYTYGVSNDDRATALASIADMEQRRKSIYKLSHVAQRQNISYIVQDLANKVEYLAFYKEDGTLIWDGASGDPVPNGTAMSDWIGSGVYIVLYDNDDPTTRKALDSVEIVVVGDTDGDGCIIAKDAAVIAANVYNGFDPNNLDYFKTARYLAGLLTERCIQISKCAATTSTHSYNYAKDQSDFIETEWYAQYQNQGQNQG